MPDKSTGQWVGGAIGVVVGAMMGNPMMGMYIGTTIGGLIDPPKGPSIDGPRLADLSVQGFQFGSPLARDYGTVGHMGIVVWVENNELLEVEDEESGDKGGASMTSFTYFATFAVALCDSVPDGIAGVRRIWVGPDLIYNAGSDDPETIIASNRAAQGFEIYYGTDDQMPDPRIEAEMGVGEAPAFRGTAYIVFYDFALAKYGNSLMGAQVKVELIIHSESVASAVIESFEVTDDVTSFTVPPTMSTAQVARHGYWTGDSLEDWSVTEHSTSGSRHVANYPRIPDDDATLQAPRGFQLFIGDFLNASWGTAATLEFQGVVRLRRRAGTGFSQFTIQTGTGMTIFDTAKKGVYDVGTIYIMATGPNPRLIRVGGFDGTVRDDIGIYDFCVSPEYVYALAPVSYPSTSYTLYTLSKSNLSTITSVPVTLPAAIPSGSLWMSFYNDLVWVAPNNESEILAAYDPLTGALMHQIDDIPVPAVVGSARPTVVVDGLLVRDNSAGAGDAIEVIRIAYPGPALPSLADVVEAELMRAEIIEAGDINVDDLLNDYVRGYTLAGVKQIRACLAPLQVAYPFDFIMDGYQIKAVRRGSSSVATIPLELLDAREYGAGPGIALQMDREMDSQLPRQVLVRNLDAEREYDTNEQRSAERQSSAAINIQEVEMAMVLTADEAAQIADVIFSVAWLQKSGPAKFKLPPVYLHLQPADVITIETPYGEFELVLTEINYLRNGTLECSALPNSAASYTSEAVGTTGTVPPGTVPLAGDSVLVLMDIPLILNADNTAGFAAAMTGQSNSWPGGIAIRSNDNEQTWTTVQAWQSAAIVGVARNALSEHDSLVIDRDSSLVIDLYLGSLSSITEAQMMTGLHWVAYGVDGRWELIRFSDADLQGDGSYLVTNMLRGLRGSEWATGLHEVGDYFVLLDDPDVMRIGADISTLNVERQWRGLTRGQSVSEVESIDFAYRAVNLTPLAPASIQGDISGGSWIITFSPRTRLQGSLWKTGVALPVGEATEQYQMDIYDGSDVVRTMTSTTNEFEYTYDQQVEDFGASNTNIDVEIFQMSATVGRGYGASANLVTSVITPHLLLHFEGADASTTCVDSSIFSRTSTAIGNAQIDTAQFRFGASSGLFDGTLDAFTFPHSADFSANQDFTIEGFIRSTTNNTTRAIFRKNAVSANTSGISVIISGTQGITAFLHNGTTAFTAQAGVAVTVNTWQHFAVVKHGSNLMVFFEGALLDTEALSGTMVDNADAVYIGGNQASSGASFSGHIDELRFVGGVAVYTASFTPPSSPFPS
jgi:hypothetical protein